MKTSQDDIHGLFMRGFNENWEYVKDSGNYRNGDNFFRVHWEIKNRDLVKGIIRFHVEAPKLEDNPDLNTLKMRFIKKVFDSDIERLAKNMAYKYDEGKKISDKNIRENKSTEVFRLILTEDQIIEAMMEKVHNLFADSIDSILEQFEQELSQRELLS